MNNNNMVYEEYFLNNKKYSNSELKNLDLRLKNRIWDEYLDLFKLLKIYDEYCLGLNLIEEIEN